jgi:queuosine precursor transporter
VSTSEATWKTSSPSTTGSTPRGWQLETGGGGEHPTASTAAQLATRAKNRIRFSAVGPARHLMVRRQGIPLVLDPRTRLLLALTGLFVAGVGTLTSLPPIRSPVMSAATALTFSIGFVPFPVTFLLTDLLNEFYGKKAARMVTWVGFAMAWFTLLVLLIADAAPFAPFTQQPDWKGVPPAAWEQVFGGSRRIEQVFGGSRRILLASIAAYLVAQLTDIAVFHLLKQRTQNRFLWLRATGSTVVSQLIDTVTIQSLAWWGTLSPETLLNLIASSYAGKVLIALLLTPLVYLGHAVVERGLGIAPVRVEPSEPA